MTNRSTLILSATDIRQTLTLGDYIDAVANSFAMFALGQMSVPEVVHIPASGGAFHVKSAGFLERAPYVAVKVNGNFPDNPATNGLPTIQGAIVLCDRRDGSLLAVMDSAEVTAMRTGAATAVAARFLAPQDARVATVVGCGVQGRVQLLALLTVLPLGQVYAYDLDGDRSNEFARAMSAQTGARVIAVGDLGEATRASQAVVTCTASRRAFLRPEHVRPGTFVAAVGADNHDKQELDPRLLADARVVVDVLEQCARIGELHHALEAGLMSEADVAASLGAVVAGVSRWVPDAEAVVVFDSTGSAIQDVAAAGIIYERARAAGIGTAIRLA